MDNHSSRFKVRLGLFVAGGFILFAIGIFLIGKQKHLFDPVVSLSTKFYNVSGLQVGNKVRFSGINIGTVDNIIIINDSTVKVDFIIKTDVQPFIKTDCQAAIGSEGIIGDRVLNITQGSADAKPVKEGQYLSSIEPVETDAIMESVSVTASNVEVITAQLAEIMGSINHGKGTLGRLITDTTIAGNIDKTIVNLRKSTKGLDENMNAAKNNFLLRGYFNKKKRAAEKLKQDAKDIQDEKANPPIEEKKK
jgi:phospholipid/cholesterol/gamma-HCH transport system substrate-binding protein